VPVLYCRILLISVTASDLILLLTDRSCLEWYTSNVVKAVSSPYSV